MTAFKEDKAREYLDWLLTPPTHRSPKTKKDFAESVGVSQRTLLNWEKMDWFIKEVKASKGPLLAAWYGDIMGRMKQVVDEGNDKDAVMAARLLMSLLELPEEKTLKGSSSSVDDMAAALKALGLKVVSDGTTESDETSSATSEQVES